MPLCVRFKINYVEQFCHKSLKPGLKLLVFNNWYQNDQLDHEDGVAFHLFDTLFVSKACHTAQNATKVPPHHSGYLGVSPTCSYSCLSQYPSVDTCTVNIKARRLALDASQGTF